jgi:hypothetical protein
MSAEDGMEKARESVIRANENFPTDPESAFEIGYNMGYRDGRVEGHTEMFEFVMGTGGVPPE